MVIDENQKVCLGLRKGKVVQWESTRGIVSRVLGTRMQRGGGEEGGVTGKGCWWELSRAKGGGLLSPLSSQHYALKKCIFHKEKRGALILYHHRAIHMKLFQDFHFCSYDICSEKDPNILLKN